MKFSSFWLKKGISVVEIIIGAAILTVVVTGVASAWQYYIKLSGEATRISQALLLTEEGAEALQHLRDTSWSEKIAPLAFETEYFLVWDGNNYITTTTPTIINGSYHRSILLSTVKRDAITANISSVGDVDMGTRMVTMKIYPSSCCMEPILISQLLIHDEFDN